MPPMKRSVLLLFLCGLSLSAPAWTAPEERIFQAGPVQNSMVQLFVSDGRSECNAALEWATAQASKDPRTVLWKTFVPVVMHVGRWDGSGFKDMMAKKEFDAALEGYVRLWKATNAYAPTVAANGVEWSGWSRGQDPPLDPARKTGILTVRAGRDPGTYLTTFKPEEALKGSDLALHAALLGFGQKSKPSEGKNRGKTLEHNFVVRQYRTQTFTSTREGTLARIELPIPKVVRPGERYAVAFWVTKKDSVVPLQATGGFLSS
jgi:hypothetical protein